MKCVSVVLFNIAHYYQCVASSDPESDIDTEGRIKG